LKLYKVPRFYQSISPSKVWSLDPDEKAVALTFDDGPNPETTDWILDVLDKYQAKANFFCVGENVKKYPDLYQKILDKGHVTANHTFNHIYGREIDEEKYLQNVLECADYVESRLFRPPHGVISKKQAEILRLNGYIIIMWSLLSYDFAKDLNQENSLEKCFKKTHNGSIIVFHDNTKAKENIEFLLPKYLEFLDKEGYKKVLLNENELIQNS
jgi:peptidoglycan/xylan/chitin deacetylase (PgdA/CDA1 family)